MKAVVLAGGQEFGQCPLSRQAPRALWPLVDKPIIEHVLRALQERAGINEVIISPTHNRFYFGGLEAPPK